MEKDYPPYFKYWGKAKKDSEQPGADYHLLPYHCLDVAAVADKWLELSPVLLKRFALYLNVEPDLARRIVLFFVLLHDLGKFDGRFQHFREDIRQELQGDEWWIEEDLSYYSHGSSGFKQFCEKFGYSEAMKAVAGHHGFCDTNFNYEEPTADDDLIDLDEQARSEWVAFCLEFCELESIPDVGGIPLLAGFCSVADWLGSSLTNFTTSPMANLQEYYEQVLPRAEAVLRDSGMITSIAGAGFSFLFPDYRPRGIQCLLDELPLSPGLTLVEADTGAGKTEFALSYASMLVEAGLADGVVFGLPTQATANGLFDRIQHAAELLFPDAKATLAHGKSHFIVTDESGFLHQSKKRAFLGTTSVATIDQILMGVLGIKHQFVRSFGTRKSVLILDEIHSFDAYMMALIEQVLKGQHEAFSSVILLSATLPHHIRNKLLNTYSGSSDSEAYPLITHTNLQGDTNVFTLPEELQQQLKRKVVCTQQWHTQDCFPEDTHIGTICDWVIQGAMVAVIFNTVADAQRLFHKISLQQPEFEVDLFHARYTVSDRQHIEKAVLEKYGKNATRSGRLLIATQVIEQSLDLDFDVIISQIAPIEYLMQRMGRLWRHERENTDLYPRTNAIKDPLFITLIPQESIHLDESISKTKTHYSGSGFVYQNIRWLYRTEKYLNQNDKLIFPDCYREAIEYVHFPEICESEPEAITEIANAFELKGEGSHYTARQISAMQSKPLNDVDPRCALLTREGEMSISVVLVDESGALLHGGSFEEQVDRERNLISLPPKHAKGTKYPDYFCTKAVVGKDIEYNNMGFIRTDLVEEFNTGGK
ncbi:CRISPR-associated endonuclease/helicase Cas3 [Marisediminitalea aggregata]|uniref:CRISPR-associated endonuclease/helicase Cas3 n=1 Tax=Marisediminitalea aggregata TaxID=634436 RepID=A0A1M5JP75_9ALTE|nr:CRISPR-associated helicase/endonuclease Cas3 [Marisediminitalea aggregata]SHG42318.1 CRISPR-associated endonuclease/helicase Cas3 [Marisediminitalea aggregata]